ncbi:MAG: hypothetical protein AB8G95_05915 [Anaerolineae bacterium]
MLIASNKQPLQFWTKRDFWFHLFILFAIFAYLYSPLFDYAMGHHIHTRPHNHIPVKLIPHGDHFHFFGDGSLVESEAADDHICTLDFAGLILIGLFVIFIACIRRPIRNAFIFAIETTWLEMILIRQPPPIPPPRSYSLVV